MHSFVVSKYLPFCLPRHSHLEFFWTSLQQFILLSCYACCNKYLSSESCFAIGGTYFHGYHFNNFFKSSNWDLKPTCTTMCLESEIYFWIIGTTMFSGSDPYVKLRMRGHSIYGGRGLKPSHMFTWPADSNFSNWIYDILMLVDL